MANHEKRRSRRSSLFALCAPLLTLLAVACSSDGGNAYERGTDPRGDADFDPETTVNLLGIWAANFTPDRCQDSLHTGSATILADAGDTTRIEAQISRMEFNTFGCSDIGDGLLGFTVFRFEASYPAQITQQEFEELLKEQLSQDGDLITEDDWTVIEFATGAISFRRTTGALGCNEDDNTDCGLFELTR
jgi:hypothetical protein